MARLGVGMPITIDVGDDVCTTSAPCVDDRTPTSMPRHSVEHLVSISMVSPLIVVLMASAATATKPKSVTISSAMSNASDAGSYVDASLVVVALILDARTMAMAGALGVSMAQHIKVGNIECSQCAESSKGGCLEVRTPALSALFAMHPTSCPTLQRRASRFAYCSANSLASSSRMSFGSRVMVLD